MKTASNETTTYLLGVSKTVWVSGVKADSFFLKNDDTTTLAAEDIVFTSSPYQAANFTVDLAKKLKQCLLNLGYAEAKIVKKTILTQVELTILK